jgi:hypothetical protein
MSGSSDTNVPAGITTNWVSLAALAIVGLLSLFSLYMGFQEWGTDQETSLIYIFIGAAGFAAIGYMVFRRQASVNTPRKELEIQKVDVVTTLECPKCNLKRVRDFKRGDYIFKDDEPCTRCDGIMKITRITRKKDEKEIAKQKKADEDTRDL